MRLVVVYAAESLGIGLCRMGIGTPSWDGTDAFFLEGTRTTKKKTVGFMRMDPHQPIVRGISCKAPFLCGSQKGDGPLIFL